MRRFRLSLLLSLPVGVLIGLACREVTAPGADGGDPAANPAPSLLLGGSPPDPVLPLQLRGFIPPDPILPVSQAWGPMQLSFITQPPDPIMPVACVQGTESAVAGMMAATLCGQINNPSGQTFLSALLFQGSINEPSASIGIGAFPVDFPTSDCARINVQATLLMPDASVTSLLSNPSSWGLAFRSVEFPLASAIGVFGTGPAGPVEQNQGASGGLRPKGSPCTVTLSKF